MGKKRSRATQTSKGIVNQSPNSMTKRISKESRREYMASGLREYNQLMAYKRGRNVVVTIPNPNTNETNKRFIKVKGRDYFKSVSK
tara:strand:- start:9919 stop:10176 length:258 start_codon:yes stop_codon:yes gene_type:complete